MRAKAQGAVIRCALVLKTFTTFKRVVKQTRFIAAFNKGVTRTLEQERRLIHIDRQTNNPVLYYYERCMVQFMAISQSNIISLA